MKPFRGKRTELGEFAVVIQPRVSARGALGDGGARRPPVGSSEARRQGGDAFARRVTGRRGVDRLDGRGAPAAHSHWERPDAVGSRLPAANCSQFAVEHAACRAVRSRDAPGVRVAWFPALRPTRLETRTKELSTRASQWALRTPKA